MTIIMDIVHNLGSETTTDFDNPSEDIIIIITKGKSGNGHHLGNGTEGEDLLVRQATEI